MSVADATARHSGSDGNGDGCRADKMHHRLYAKGIDPKPIASRSPRPAIYQRLTRPSRRLVSLTDVIWRRLGYAMRRCYFINSAGRHFTSHQGKQPRRAYYDAESCHHASFIDVSDFTPSCGFSISCFLAVAISARCVTTAARQDAPGSPPCT